MIYDWNENQDEQKKKEEREQTLDDGQSSVSTFLRINFSTIHFSIHSLPFLFFSILFLLLE